MPTFMIFKGGKQVEKVQGADPKKLQDIVRKLAAEADDSGDSSSGFASGSGSGDWRAGALPRGYSDVTDQVDVKGLELLNADSEFGSVRTLVDTSKPSALSNGKAVDSKAKDWVVSDTDEQLMLFMPFQSTLKVHSVQVRGVNHLRKFLKYIEAKLLFHRSPLYLQHPMTRMVMMKSQCDQKPSRSTQTGLTQLALTRLKVFLRHKPSHWKPRTGIQLALLHYRSALSSSRMLQAWYSSL